MFNPSQLLTVSLLSFSRHLMQECPPDFINCHSYRPEDEDTVDSISTYWLGPTLWATAATVSSGMEQLHIVDSAEGVVYPVKHIPEASRLVASMVHTYTGHYLSSVHRTSSVCADGFMVNLSSTDPELLLRFEWVDRLLDGTVIWQNNHGNRCVFSPSPDSFSTHIGEWIDGSFSRHNSIMYVPTSHGASYKAIP